MDHRKAGEGIDMPVSSTITRRTGTTRATGLDAKYAFVVKGRDLRIGTCGDIGHWSRSVSIPLRRSS
jgi:hypothetical protein